MARRQQQQQSTDDQEEKGEEGQGGARDDHHPYVYNNTSIPPRSKAIQPEVVFGQSPSPSQPLHHHHQEEVEFELPPEKEPGGCAEGAGQAAATCAAMLCFPWGVLDFLFVVTIKLPAGLIRRTVRRQRQRKRQRHSGATAAHTPFHSVYDDYSAFSPFNPSSSNDVAPPPSAAAFYFGYQQDDDNDMDDRHHRNKELLKHDDQQAAATAGSWAWPPASPLSPGVLEWEKELGSKFHGFGFGGSRSNRSTA